MARIKNHKPIIFILVTLLFVLSASVLLIPDTRTYQSVRVHNKNFTISQGSPVVSNTNVGLNNNSASVQNEDIETLNKEFNMNNSDMNLGAKSSKVKFTSVDGQKIKYKNSDPFDDIGKNTKNSDTNFSDKKIDIKNTARYQRELKRYKYKNINWGTWKSRFVNRILDDSLYIKSLDTYGIGTWFYYSFEVTNTGEIHDVTVFSLYLTEEDKMRIRQLIRSYEGMPITIFPENSKRKKVKVKAIMLLGDSEQKANSSNFSDTEKVKIRY